MIQFPSVDVIAMVSEKGQGIGIEVSRSPVAQIRLKLKLLLGGVPTPNGEVSRRYLKGVWTFSDSARVWYIPSGVTIPATAINIVMAVMRAVRRTTVLRAP